MSPNAVCAFFTYSNDDGAELDFEYIRNDKGAYGWALTVHMPSATGGGRKSSKTTFVAYSHEEFKMPRRFSIDHDERRCQFKIDGKVIHEVKPADMPTARWSVTSKFDAICSIEEHNSWAGKHTYGASNMTVHAVSVPGL